MSERDSSSMLNQANPYFIGLKKRLNKKKDASEQDLAAKKISSKKILNSSQYKANSLTMEKSKTRFQS